MSKRKKHQLENKIIEFLERNGEASTAVIGKETVRSPSGNCSNPGTLAAAATLRRMEREGTVRARLVIGAGYSRTLWRMSDR